MECGGVEGVVTAARTDLLRSFSDLNQEHGGLNWPSGAAAKWRELRNTHFVLGEGE